MASKEVKFRSRLLSNVETLESFFDDMLIVRSKAATTSVINVKQEHTHCFVSVRIATYVG